MAKRKLAQRIRLEASLIRLTCPLKGLEHSPEFIRIRIAVLKVRGQNEDQVRLVVLVGIDVADIVA